MRTGRWRVWLVLACLLLTACSVPGINSSSSEQQTKRIRISGAIYGQDMQAALAGRLASPLPIPAHVRCNEMNVVADAAGRYTVAVRQTDSYHCTVSYSGYSEGKASVTAAEPQQDIALNFGPVAATACDAATPYAPIICAPLAPIPGKLTGTVTVAGTHAPLKNTAVECWSNLDQPQLANLALTTTDTQGNYTFATVAAGPNACVVLGKDDLYHAQIESGKTATLDMQVCQSHCPSFQNHGGSVMESSTAYLIFWLPRNHTFEPNGGSARFESLMAQYFRDVGGTPFYGMLTQYWGNQGQIHNHVELGGVYVDTQAYPEAGTRAHPLIGSDIDNEIRRVMKVTRWEQSPTHAFFLFTGYGVQECSLPNHSHGCTFYTGHDDYCAYHTYDSGLIYAYIPVESSCVGLPGRSPNGDVVADSIISIVSHEQFESVTDPLIDAWYTKEAWDGEIADICLRHYGAVRADGSNVTLNHGHRYIVQEEWSRRAGRCALS